MKKKPRVLIDSFHLLQALTGIRTYTTELCKGLQDSDQQEVEYVIYPDWEWVNKTTFLRGKVNVFKKLLNHAVFFFWKQCCLPLIILFKRVDMVVAPDYLLPAIKFGARGLSVVHDTFYWELDGAYNPVWRWYFLKSVSLGLSRQSAMVVTTQYIAQKAKKHVSAQLPASVVYQAPKTLDYAPQPLDELGIPAGAQYLLHVGIFERRKNLGVLVKAFALLVKEDYFQDFYLVLAGSRAVGIFHDDYSKLKKLIKDLDLNDRVIMPGFVPNELLGSLYQKAFCYVFPSKEEGFGIPVLEAMNSGIPVVISDQPALMEVGAEAVLTFEQDDEEGLYKALLILESKEARAVLIKKGRERAEQFSQKAFINQFHAAVLQQLHS